MWAGSVKLVFAEIGCQNSFAIEVENYSIENYYSLRLLGSVSNLQLMRCCAFENLRVNYINFKSRLLV